MQTSACLQAVDEHYPLINYQLQESANLLPICSPAFQPLDNQYSWIQTAFCSAATMAPNIRQVRQGTAHRRRRRNSSGGQPRR